MSHNFIVFLPSSLSPGCKVQGTFIVIILEVDAGSKPDKILQTADMALTTCIM